MRIFPSNKAALAGDKLTLKCRSSSLVGLWTFTPVDNSTSLPIVKDCAVLEPFADQYAVNTSDQGCDLLINSVKMNQSGTYACKVEEAPGFFATSQVVVLQSKPKCTINVTKGSVEAGEWLEAKCLSNISKNGELTMNCRNWSGSPIGIPGLTSDNSISIYVQANDPPVLQPFYCIVTITIKPVLTTHGNIASNSTTDYVYKWTSLTLNDLCPPGFDFVPGVNGCYRSVMELLYWSTASQRCQQLYSGAYSVIINSEAEQNAIFSYMNATLSSPCYSTQWNQFYVWIGAQTQTLNYSSPFVWKPNPKITLPVVYCNWGTVEPTRGAGSNEFCIAMAVKLRVFWLDTPCYNKYCVLCEYGPY